LVGIGSPSYWVRRGTLKLHALGGIYDHELAALFLVLATGCAYGLLRWLLRVLARRTAIVNAALGGEARFRLLAEAIPQIVWTANPAGGVDYCNQRFYDLTGFRSEQALGWGWQEALHPDDQPSAVENWEKALRMGEPYEIEYRLRSGDGKFRWHLVRATPRRDSAGKVVKWYGAATDIDDQMRHQQVLEAQIKQHVQALMDANSRLEKEMAERASTQHELNLQSERMVRDLTRRSNRATNLAKMAEFLQSAADVKEACSVVAGMAPKVFPELRGAVLLFNSGPKILEVAATWSDCDLKATAIPPSECWALRSGRRHIVAAGEHAVECAHAAASGKYSYVCLPLLAHSEPIGLAHLQTIESPELSEPLLLIANMFAEQVGLSIANIRLREALRTQSIHDPLTGLYNRRYLQEMLERDTRRAVRAEQGMGVLMLDLDHFKKFNDTYGHEAGDTVLRETASFLLRSVRAEDIVCRYGGEEFVILLPVADLEITQARAERICSRLRELSVIHQGRSVGPVTVSIGVAELPQHGTTCKELLESADAALYRAKREGRDRVATAEDILPAAVQMI